MVIAIDGPAGAGKSTVARAVADALGFTYLDSGAMYRCVALATLQAGIDLGDAEAVGRIARGVQVDFNSDRVLLDGADVSDEIRAPEVSAGASHVSVHPEVREAVVERQRALIESGDYVAEGRDIGTVVSPDAALKVFLTASPEERARRRAQDLGSADWRTVLRDQTLRDQQDEQREHSPLRAAPDAIELDSTDRTLEDVVAQIAGLVQERRAD